MENRISSRRKKLIVFFSILFGLFMGFLAYNFVPKSDYDLVRQWKVMDRFESVETVEEFIKTTETVDREIIPQIYSLLISKTGNHNLLQFFVVVVGYAALCYILLDCRDRAKLSDVKFIMVFILAILGQSMLYYFSGLYNYLAINLFALAVYLDYIKKYRKTAWIVYIVSPLIHSSMVLPLFLVVLLKLIRNKVDIKFLGLFVVVLMLFGPIIDLVIELFNIDFLNDIKSIYDSYILANDGMIKYYDGFYLFMSVSKIGIALVACWLQKGKETTTPIRSMVYLTTCVVIILSLSSIAITRFSSLVLFVSLPLIMDAMFEKGKRQQLFTGVVFITALLYLVYTVRMMMPLIQIGGANV